MAKCFGNTTILACLKSTVNLFHLFFLFFLIIANTKINLFKGVWLFREPKELMQFLSVSDCFYVSSMSPFASYVLRLCLRRSSY